MDDKSKRGKEKDGSTSAPPIAARPGGLRFKPRVPTKKASKGVPKIACVPLKEDPMLGIMKLVSRFHLDQQTHQLQDLFTPLKVLRQLKKEKDVHLFSKSMLSEVTTSAAKLPKQCAEPQDFTHPDYNYPPITIPPRRHYSGDPEIFYEEDFSEFSSSRAQDDEITAAQELGLMDTDEMTSEPQLFLVQFPSSLPLPRQVESVAEADMDTSEDVETDGTEPKESVS